LVSLGLVLLAAFLGLWFLRSTRQPESALSKLGLEAEIAKQALLTGAGLKDVIVRCYRQMSQALQGERGLEREAFMTTREFERLLEESGFPHDPVHTLTRLFEAVRYGHWQPDPNDEQNAIACLEAIVTYGRAASRVARDEK
jgi:hypothetical protein